MSEAGKNVPRQVRGKAASPLAKGSSQSTSALAQHNVVLPRFLADAPRQASCLDAWTHFAHELAIALRGLEEDDWLVLSAKKRNRYVQFMNQRCGFRAETVSDFYLADDDHLTEEDRMSLLRLGWDAPTNLPDEFGRLPDGSANYFVDLANPVPLEELAALAVSTLADVHRLQHPNALEYSAESSDNRSIRFPNLGIRRAG